MGHRLIYQFFAFVLSVAFGTAALAIEPDLMPKSEQELKALGDFCRPALRALSVGGGWVGRTTLKAGKLIASKSRDFVQHQRPMDPRDESSLVALIKVAESEGPSAAKRLFFRMIQSVSPLSNSVGANLSVLAILKPNRLSEGYFLSDRLKQFEKNSRAEGLSPTVLDYALYSVLVSRESRDGVLNHALPMNESKLKAFARIRRAGKWYVILPTLAIIGSMAKLALVAGYGTPLVSAFNQRPNAAIFGATTKLGFLTWGKILGTPEDHPYKETLDEQAQILERMNELSERASAGIIDPDQAWADFEALVKVFPKIYGSGGEKLGASELWGQAMINDAWQNAYAAVDAYSNKKDTLNQTQDILDVGMLHGAPLTPEKRKELETRVFMLKREVGLNIARKEAIRIIYPFVEEHHRGIDRFALAMGEPEVIKLVGGRDIVMQLYMEAFAEVYNIPILASHSEQSNR